MVEPGGGADEAEQDPGAGHDEDGGVGELVEPEERALLADVQLQGLLAQAHLVPLLPPPLRLRLLPPRPRGIVPLLLALHHPHLHGVRVLHAAGLVPGPEAVLDVGGLGAGRGRGRGCGVRGGLGRGGRGAVAGVAVRCGFGGEVAVVEGVREEERLGAGGAVEEERERGGEQEVIHGVAGPDGF